MHLCSDLTSGCIATGMGMGVGTLGNKGAVAVNMRLCGTTTLTVVNSHLAAHQNAVKKRNEEFRKIHRDMPSVRIYVYVYICRYVSLFLPLFLA